MSVTLLPNGTSIAQSNTFRLSDSIEDRNDPFIEVVTDFDVVKELKRAKTNILAYNRDRIIINVQSSCTEYLNFCYQYTLYIAC